MINKYEEIYQIDGPRQGPVVTILAGVHGNEVPGILAVEKLIPKLRIKQGRLYILYGNPRAILSSTRETEQNLNRMFFDNPSENILRSYEYKRATLIRKYLDQSDVCLDLHASSSKKGEAFCITEEEGFALAKQLPINQILTNIDPFHPGSTDGYMNNNGKIGICVECGYLSDAGASVIAEESIITLLKEMNMLESPLSTLGDGNKFPGVDETKSIYQVSGQYLSKFQNFNLQQEYSDFDIIPKQEIIAIDGGAPVRFDKEIFILFAREPNKPGEECFLSLERTKKMD
jgi:succinylglutamate desuccinylase